MFERWKKTDEDCTVRLTEAGEAAIDEAESAESAAEPCECDSGAGGDITGDSTNDIGGYITRIAELELLLSEAEAERCRRERELCCLSLLADAGLPSSLAPAMMAAENMSSAIDAVKSTVMAMVEAEVLRRCGADAPKAGARPALSRDDLRRMSVAQLQRLSDLGIR